jgi:hypothetical protein
MSKPHAVDLLHGFSLTWSSAMDELERNNLSLERAAELVIMLKKVDEIAACDLFCHFGDLFKLGQEHRHDGGKAIGTFAMCCDYAIATNIKGEKDNG